MSFCPTNDIHSVYLDNELPQEFIADYEAHVKECPQCQAELNKLKAVHSLFASDSKNITPDSHYLDESYERLKVKMAYNKNVKSHKKTLQIKDLSYIVTAAAAVIAFAFIVPVRVISGKKSFSTVATVPSSVSVPYINSANNVSFDSGRSVVISGNIGDKMLSSVRENDMIRNVEILRPDFVEDNTISIKITFPGMYDGPIPHDMPLPEIVVTGRFE